MSTKGPWSDKVKIWELYYLQKTPIDRIRYKLSQLENVSAYSWSTVKGVVDEFPFLSKAQVRELPNTLQMRWRELQSQKNAGQQGCLQVDQHEPKTTVLDGDRTHQLIEKWRIEAASYSPIQLLQTRLEEASQEALSRFFTNKDTKMLYLEARRPHLETFDPKRLYLQVESDPIFGLLRQKFPTSTVWTALEAWGEQAVPYLRVFDDMLDLIERAVHRVFDEQGIDNSNLSVFITRCRMERSYAVLVACDLLASGVTELPNNMRWALLVSDLEKLRLRVNLELSSLTRHTPKGGWSSGIKDICRCSLGFLDPLEETRTFLSELVKLQSTEDSLAIALQELESKMKRPTNCQRMLS